MIVLSLISLTGSAQSTTNDFYDDAEIVNLPGTTKIQVGGEIENPGTIDLAELPLRSLIIKEALASGDSNKFEGAYRYDGYSLYDILNNVVSKKKNAEEFPPIIDLYVKIENSKGESVIFSWGEIYYPVHRHEIIIATRVARIVPSKTKELWNLPLETKIVAGHDLVTERNISNPVKISVLTADVKYIVNKELTPLFSSNIQIKNGDTFLEYITPKPSPGKKLTYETVFYGRGQGIHSTTPFTGYILKDKLKPHFTASKENIQKGFFVVASVDGYRAVFTYSEIFNRNDQAEILLIDDPKNQDGGAFRLFPAADFFSDRAVKAIMEINYMTLR
jgi:hypothetical protein